MEIQDAKQARPHCELIAELLDSRQPKTEREHAAVREIERLRHDIERHIAIASEYATECERLRAELAALVNLRAEADSAWDSATYNAERARKAEAELAACREDAERYRWLREHWDDVNHPVDFIICNSFVTTLDADVDAARKGEVET